MNVGHLDKQREVMVIVEMMVVVGIVVNGCVVIPLAAHSAHRQRSF